jgi:hypothetical protein
VLAHPGAMVKGAATPMTSFYRTVSPSASPTPELPELVEARARAGVAILDRVGAERDCPRCGLRTEWTGYDWEHCDAGATSGTLTCPHRPSGGGVMTAPSTPRTVARPMTGWSDRVCVQDFCANCGGTVTVMIGGGGHIDASGRVRVVVWHNATCVEECAS